ncbi:ASST-domain-containing protein [Lasiosphaeria ovina]|uniref:ASST-domain-containing protein n=1 Tax=Lasiosphaeria ovina TaxID=92902 RepID=A0AAE0NFH7_9PEZI|nr:ASST-domain-containing protein [Lasiosphaeria ovina]
MNRFATLFGLLALTAHHALADWQYRSRPDLSPPRLNITIPATDDVAPGYIFVTPYPASNGPHAAPEQPAAYIFRNDGDLVWSSLGYFAGWVGNFQVTKYRGQTALQAFQGTLNPLHGHGYGTVALLDETYRPVANLQSLHKLVSIHEFRIVNEKTALVEIYQPTPYNLGPYGGAEDQQWIVDGVWQELDIETGELLFEGHSLDFADPADSATPLRGSTGTTSGDAWDYFHLNSIDKDDEGNYLLSGRHTSTIYKVSGRDGRVIWQLGGRNSSFTLLPRNSNDNDNNNNNDDNPKESSTAFAFQHDARFLWRSADGAIETISFFDNSAASSSSPSSSPSSSSSSSSSARIVQLNHTAVPRTAREVHRFRAPGGLVAASQGNAQVLPAGNGEVGSVFVNWGSSGAVSEFRVGADGDDDAAPVFHAFLDAAGAVQSYRGFRFAWAGRSRETPALVALWGDKVVVAHVSWNGDTVAREWVFYAEAVGGEADAGTVTHRLGAKAKVSFETTFEVSEEAVRVLGSRFVVFAVALDAAGEAVGRSGKVHVRDDVPGGPGRENGFDALIQGAVELSVFGDSVTGDDDL